MSTRWSWLDSIFLFWEQNNSYLAWLILPALWIVPVSRIDLVVPLYCFQVLQISFGKCHSVELVSMFLSFPFYQNHLLYHNQWMRACQEDIDPIPAPIPFIFNNRLRASFHVFDRCLYLEVPQRHLQRVQTHLCLQILWVHLHTPSL